jgi:hypothetical protein
MGRGVSRPAGVAGEVPGRVSGGASSAPVGNASSAGPQENPINDAVESSSRDRVGCGDVLERRMERPGDDDWED